MKTLFFILSMTIAGSSFAQIRSVSLQASGLTCSMCSRAIYKSLKKLPEVASVQEDIEHSSYHIQFSNPETVSLSDLKKAVKDAGFSVARMEVNANFHHAEVASDSSLKLNDFIFHFVDINRQTLNGETRLLIVDRDYLQDKDRKKYAGSFEAIPVTNGGVGTFHVTIPQS
jgi:copper chaperone CopZ